MTTISVNRAVPQNSKYKISRRGRKLQLTDDLRTLVALPKDVPERTWYCIFRELRAEILQKEDNELFILDVREELLEEALRVGYERYMAKQNALFTVHCAAQAWLKLIDWYFYLHDPGEEPTAHPPCYIPKRLESWTPDEMPDPSPRDTWGRQKLNVIEETVEESLVRWPSSSSIDLPVVEEIPKEYWFPGKVELPGESDMYDDSVEIRRRRPPGDATEMSEGWVSLDDYSVSPPSDLAAESELLQKVTDYSTEDLLPKESILSALKTTTPVEGSLHGAGDSTLQRTKKLPTQKSKILSRQSVRSKSKASLAPLDSHSRISVISDCRLRNLRLDTQYEISSEKMDSPPGDIVKRKK